MSLTEHQKAYLNNYAATLRDSADHEYIAARSLYKDELDDQFYWHAQQSLEKYLKAILLFNEQKIKDQGHNLSKLYSKMVESLELTNDPAVMNYLNNIEFIGLNRYDVREQSSVDLSLLVLDKLVYFFRRFCDRVNDDRQKQNFKFISLNDDYKKRAISFGYLEKVLENKSTKYDSQRKALIWKNFYFGKNKKQKIRNYAFKRSSSTSILFRHKDAYMLLKEYIKISNDDVKLFEEKHQLVSQ